MGIRFDHVVYAFHRSKNESRKSKYKVKQACYKVNLTQIDQVKKEYLMRRSDEFNDPAFISTNDILTSWFFTKNKKADNIMMSMDLRRRLSILHENLAGNYLGVKCLKKYDIKYPENVRKAVDNTFGKNLGYASIPNFKDSTKYLWGLHTNWTSFYKPLVIDETLELENCQPMLQFNFPQIMGMEMPLNEILISYRSNDDEITVYILNGAGAITEEDLDRDPMLSEKLYWVDQVQAEAKV